MTSNDRVLIRHHDLVHQILSGLSDAEYVYHDFRHIGEGMAAEVFRAYRYRRGATLGPGERRELLFIIKVPWTSVVMLDGSPLIETAEGDSFKKECRTTAELTGFPGLPAESDVKTIYVDIEFDTADGPKRASGHVSVLVTTLKFAGGLGALPIELGAFLQPLGVRTDRDFENWLTIAKTLANALIAIHKSGHHHLDISPQNVVLRVDNGWFRDVTLIDFGNSNAELPPERNDRCLYDRELLGALLLRVLDGRPRPDATVEVQDLHIGIALPLFKARGVCSRYLNNSASDPSINFSINRLHSFLAQLEELRTSWLIGTVRGQTWDVAEGVFRSQIPPAIEQADAPLPSIDGRSPSLQLRALLQLPHDELFEGLSRITAVPPEFLIPSSGRRINLDEIKKQLRAGYVSWAKARLLEWIQTYYGGSCSKAEAQDLVSGLRLLVGVILARDGDFAKSREILKQFETYEPPAVSQWAQFLSDKTIYHEGTGSMVHEQGLEAYEDPDFVSHYFDDEQAKEHMSKERERAGAWEIALKGLVSVRKARREDKILTRRDLDRSAEAMVRASSRYEMAFGALVFARGLCLTDDPGQWRHSLATVASSAWIASLRLLPHEYAAAVMIAAVIVHETATLPRFVTLRSRLIGCGVDLDECLILAASCARLAADLYGGLGLTDRSIECLRLAAQCELATRFHQQWADSLRWLSLAENLAIVRQRTESLELVQRARTRALQVWSNGVSAFHGGITDTDPGTFFSWRSYNRYGSTMSAVWDCDGGLAIELVNRDDRRSDPGAATLSMIRKAALPPRSNVIEIGCGEGNDTASILRTSDHRVTGVDSSMWNIDRAGQRCSSMRCDLRYEFLIEDVVGDTFAEVLLRRGHFDACICRDSLMLITRKERAVRNIRRVLKLGGKLLLTDWIARREASTAEWARLCNTMWFTRILTQSGLDLILRQNGFKVSPAEDHTDDLDLFVASRIERCRKLRDDINVETAVGYDQRKQMSRAKQSYEDVLGSLKETRAAIDNKLLGWTWVLAEAVQTREF